MGLLLILLAETILNFSKLIKLLTKLEQKLIPEAELIFGAIKDENLNGKMRVSIVALALDGLVPISKSVVNMVHRIHNRNLVIQ